MLGEPKSPPKDFCENIVKKFIFRWAENLSMSKFQRSSGEIYFCPDS